MDQPIGFKNKKKYDGYLLSGPTFISNSIHLGTTLNMFLKQFFIIGETVYNGRNIQLWHGIDAHGLPTENKVLKEAGVSYLDAKQDLAKFKLKIKHYIEKNSENLLKEFNMLNLQNPLSIDNTYSTESIDYYHLVWSIYQKLNQGGFIAEETRIRPYCIACSSTLANAELEPVTTTIQGLFYRFSAKNAEFVGFVLIWTTIPWTVLAHTGIMYSRRIEYAIFRAEDGTMYLAKMQLPEALQTQLTYIKAVDEAFLESLQIDYMGRTTKLYDEPDYVKDAVHTTGFVNLAGAYSDVDHSVCLKRGLPYYQVLDLAGTLIDSEISVLESAKILKLVSPDTLHVSTFDKEVNTCYRCHNVTVPHLSKQYVLKISPKLKKVMLANLASVTWAEPTYKLAFTAWLTNAQDWCISRERLYGIPLFPPNVDTSGIRSIEEAHILHTQYPQKVFDVWFESGSAAVLRPTASEYFVEGVDQIRGWLYVTTVLSTHLRKPVPFKKVFMHGYLLESKRLKLSKSKLGPNYDFHTYLTETLAGCSVQAIRLYLLSNKVHTGFVYNECTVFAFEQKIRIIYNTLSYLESQKTESKTSNQSLALLVLDQIFRECYTEYDKLKILFEELAIQKYSLTIVNYLVQKVSRVYIKMYKLIHVTTPATTKKCLEIAKLLKTMLAPIIGISKTFETTTAMLTSFSDLKPAITTRIVNFVAQALFYNRVDLQVICENYSKIMKFRELYRYNLKIKVDISRDALRGVLEPTLTLIKKLCNIGQLVETTINKDILILNSDYTADNITRHIVSYVNNKLKKSFKLLTVVLYENTAALETEIKENCRTYLPSEVLEKINFKNGERANLPELHELLKDVFIKVDL